MKNPKRRMYPMGGEIPAEMGGGDPNDPNKPPLTPEQIKAKYKSNPYVTNGREGWGAMLDKTLPQSGGKVKVRDAIMNASKFSGVDPSLLYSSAAEEGLGFAISRPDDVSEAYVNWEAKNKKLASQYRVDGFYNYGLDTFGDQYAALAKKGYLPEGFDKRFTKFAAKNESGNTYNSAAFMTDEDALIAKSAMIRDTQDNVNSYAKKKGLTLTDRQREFFTLAGYNGGLGNLDKMLDSYNAKGYLKDDKFLDATFKPASYGSIYTNVQRRLQNRQVLKDEGFLEKGGRIKYQDGTEDPILGTTGPQLKPGAKNAGVDVWGQGLNAQVPINPNAPKDQQIFALNQQPGTPDNSQTPIVPLSQFYDQYTDAFGNKQLSGTGQYVNNQGQVNTLADQQTANNQISADNLANANRREGIMDDAEMYASTGITAINSFFNKKNSAQAQRKDRRIALMQQIDNQVYNPYAEGTGSQAIFKKGGKIDGQTQGFQVTDGGKSEIISGNNHSNPMVEFKGKDHDKGGIGVAYGGKISEVEDKEVGWIDPNGSLNIFGKLKIPGTNQTFRKAAKDLADKEEKVDGKMSLYTNILNNGDPGDKYQESAQSTAKVMFKSLDRQQKQITEQKAALSDYQSLILEMADVTGEKMKYGGKMPRKKFANGGDIFDDETQDNGPDDPIQIIPLKSDFNKGGRGKIKGVVLHKTAGTGNAKNVIAGWDSDNRKASADYIIDTDGSITQVGDLGDTKWHSGKRNVNQQTLGIEIVGKSADESDMTDAQYKALARLQKDVFAPMGITANDYFGHTQVNRKKGFDFGSDKSIANVLKKAGISDTYTPNNTFELNSMSANAGNAGNDPYPKTFKQFKDRSGRQYNSPAGLDPATFYKDPAIIQALKDDKTFPNAADDANWGTEHDKIWNSLSQAKKDELLQKSQATQVTANNTISNSNISPLATNQLLGNQQQPLGITAAPKQINTGQNPNGIVPTQYGLASTDPTPFSDKVNIGAGNRTRDYISPLAIEQIAPELLTIATNKKQAVEQLSYSPELLQTFDLSYQLGRNENQSTFNQVAQLAQQSGNVDALGQLAAQKYKADEAYNMQEVQGNAKQKLEVYAQNVATLNDAKVKNLALLNDQQNKQAAADFNTRKEDISAFTSISGKVLQNNLENKTYNAYANLFKHYGFDKKGNVTFNPDEVTTKFTPGEANQFGLMAAQQGANAIMSGDFNRQFKKVKNEDGSTTTTETLGKNKKLQDEYKTLKNQGFDDALIGNMLRAKYPETITQ